MPLNTFAGKFSMAGSLAALTIAAPPLLGAAFAQSYFPPPGYGVAIYPPPREAVDVYPPPGAVEEVNPVPRDPVNVYPPSGEAEEVTPPPRDAVDVYPPRKTVDANWPARDAVNVPAQQLSGTTTPISAVSMRAGPGTDNPVIGTLHPGVPLQLLATANHGWMQVQSPTGTGWVYGSYLASGTGVTGPTNISAQAATNVSVPASNSGSNQPASASNRPPPEITSP
ncbi:MAG: SH3 domain-containing protein [Stellaceae bacterium]